MLGLDIGDKRIGVALSDQSAVIASPLKIIDRSNLQQDVEAILAIINQNEAEIIVAGLPLTKDNDIGHQAEKVKNFTEYLAQKAGVPIVYRDESLTTLEARNVMRITRKKKKRQKEKDDAIAAALILQRYLDEKQNSTGSPLAAD